MFGVHAGPFGSVQRKLTSNCDPGCFCCVKKPHTCIHSASYSNHYKPVVMMMMHRLPRTSTGRCRCSWPALAACAAQRTLRTTTAATAASQLLLTAPDSQPTASHHNCSMHHSQPTDRHAADQAESAVHCTPVTNPPPYILQHTVSSQPKHTTIKPLYDMPQHTQATPTITHLSVLLHPANQQPQNTSLKTRPLQHATVPAECCAVVVRTCCALCCALCCAVLCALYD